jgi:hypothetical protein
MVYWGLGHLGKFDHINQMITLSVITLSVFHCSKFNLVRNEECIMSRHLSKYNIQWALLNGITLGPRQTDSINRMIPLIDTHFA